MTALFLVLLLSLGLFAACDKVDPPSNDPNGNTEANTPNNDSDPSTAREKKYKEDIIIGISGKIIDIDPQQNSNTHHNYYFRAVFDTPLHFNNSTSKLEPQACTEWSTEDGITYNFTVRENVTFHNGDPLTAEDFKFTFERGVDTDSSSTLCKMIEEITVTDDMHFTVKLKRANVDFPYMLTLPTASILSKKAFDDGVTDATGIGTGQFKLDSYEFGDFLKMVRNDGYWGEVLPTKSVTLRYMPENSARLVALETGEIDVCQDPDTNELSHVTGNDKLDLQTYTSSAIQYVAFNYAKPPFSDKNLRLALCYGIDRQELIDVTYNGNGEMNKSTWGWNEFGYTELPEYYEYNPEKAKEYLAAAGYGESNPFAFVLSVSAGTRKTMGELIQAQMKKLGVTVTLNEMDTAGLSTSTTAGDHEACIYGCGTNVFGDDIRRLICPGTGVNKSHYDNAEVNALMDKAVAETDDTKRLEMYRQVQQILFEDGAYLPICCAEASFAVKKGVSGIDYYPTSHHDLSDIVMVIE